MDLLVRKIKEIEMPDDMRKRIAENCYKEIELRNPVKDTISEEKIVSRNRKSNAKIEKKRNEIKMSIEKCDRSKRGVTRMKVKKENNVWKKQLPFAAALALCVCITGATSLAATGKLQGYFKDITNWNGAITGTTYEQATDEIIVSIGEVTEEISILITIEDSEKPPYRESELFGIGNYRIEDMSGNIIVSESSFAERTSFTSQMSLKVPLEQISNGKYKLIIEQFISEKKADQPLRINGNWECEFEYNSGI